MLRCGDMLYVYEGGTLAQAAEVVGRVIGLSLELHDSSFYGGDYYRAQRNLDEVIVLENYTEDDGEPFFQAQPVGALCVQVTGFDEARQRLAPVPGLRASKRRRERGGPRSGTLVHALGVALDLTFGVRP